jgi:hypothetical protein
VAVDFPRAGRIDEAIARAALYIWRAREAASFEQLVVTPTLAAVCPPASLSRFLGRG